VTPRPQRRPPGYYDLLEAVQSDGCPLCRLSVEVIASYIDNLLYGSVNDFDLRERLRQSRGLCHTHAWQMVRPGGSLGAAIIQNDVLGELLHVLEGKAESRLRGDLERSLEPQTECPACQHQAEMETIYLSALFKSLADEEFWEAYCGSSGLCLPHFQAALRQCRHGSVRQRLVQAQRGFWQRLRGELVEFIRKNDYRFRDEGFGAEGDSWQRAIAQVVGHVDL